MFELRSVAVIDVVGEAHLWAIVANYIVHVEYFNNVISVKLRILVRVAKFAVQIGTRFTSSCVWAAEVERPIIHLSKRIRFELGRDSLLQLCRSRTTNTINQGVEPGGVGVFIIPLPNCY